MKKYSYTLIIALLGLTFVACEDEEDNAIPHITSPVLVEVETLGRYTPLDQVTLMTKVSDLDKTNILTEVEGIDTIPAALASVQVVKDIDGAASEFFSPLTLSDGTGTIVANWTDILPADVSPEDGATIEFEYFETYEDTPFRKIYRLDYSTTAFTGELPVYETVVDGEEVALPIVENDQTYTFSYDLISVDETGVDITVEQQLNGGEFTTLTPPEGGWSADGTIAYVGTNYTQGDEVTIRITGRKNELVSDELFTFTVGKYEFSEFNDNLTLSMKEVLDLDAGEVLAPESADVSTVQLVADPVQSNLVGFRFSDEKPFVVLDGDTYADVYDSKDFAAAKRLFESEEKVTAVEDVELEDLYLYQYEDNGQTYTGLIKVIDYTKTNVGNNDSITLEYSSGVE